MSGELSLKQCADGLLCCSNCMVQPAEGPGLHRAAPRYIGTEKSSLLQIKVERSNLSLGVPLTPTAFAIIEPYCVTLFLTGFNLDCLKRLNYAREG